MTEDDDILRRLSRLEEKTDTLEQRMNGVEQRLTAYEAKVETILDTTGQIKDLLTTNGRDTKSAKRNAKGWGFASVFVSVFFKIGEFFIRNGVAL